MKILIIRTLKSELIPYVVRKLKKEFNKSSLFLLTHENQESLNFFKSKFTKVFIYNSKNDYSLKNISKKLLKQLKKEKFDLIILPRVFNTKDGFLDAIGLSFFINSSKVAILPHEKELIYVNRTYLIKFFSIKLFGIFLSILLQVIFWPIFIFNFIIKKIRT